MTKLSLLLSLFLIISSCTKKSQNEELIDPSTETPIAAEFNLLFDSNLDENTTESILMRVGSRPGSKQKVRIQMTNKSGQNLDLSNLTASVESLRSDLSVTRNRCPSTLRNNRNCYFDLQVTYNDQVTIDETLYILPLGGTSNLVDPNIALVVNVNETYANELENSSSSLLKSQSVINFGLLKEGESKRSRIYVNNISSVLTLTAPSFPETLPAGLTVLNTTCPSEIKPKGFCYFNLLYDYQGTPGEDAVLVDESIDLVSDYLSDTSLQIIANNVKSLDPSKAKVTISEVEFPTQTQAGKEYIKRFYISNTVDQNVSFDASNIINGATVLKNSCVSGTLKPGQYCYIDIQTSVQNDGDEIPTIQVNIPEANLVANVHSDSSVVDCSLDSSNSLCNDSVCSLVIENDPDCDEENDGGGIVDNGDRQPTYNNAYNGKLFIEAKPSFISKNANPGNYSKIEAYHGNKTLYSIEDYQTNKTKIGVARFENNTYQYMRMIVDLSKVESYSFIFSNGLNRMQVKFVTKSMSESFCNSLSNSQSFSSSCRLNGYTSGVDYKTDSRIQSCLNEGYRVYLNYNQSTSTPYAQCNSGSTNLNYADTDAFSGDKDYYVNQDSSHSLLSVNDFNKYKYLVMHDKTNWSHTLVEDLFQGLKGEANNLSFDYSLKGESIQYILGSHDGKIREIDFSNGTVTTIGTLPSTYMASSSTFLLTKDRYDDKLWISKGTQGSGVIVYDISDGAIFKDFDQDSSIHRAVQNKKLAFMPSRIYFVAQETSTKRFDVHYIDRSNCSSTNCPVNYLVDSGKRDHRIFNDGASITTSLTDFANKTYFVQQDLNGLESLFILDNSNNLINTGFSRSKLENNVRTSSDFLEFDYYDQKERTRPYIVTTTASSNTISEIKKELHIVNSLTGDVVLATSISYDTPNLFNWTSTGINSSEDIANADILESNLNVVGAYNSKVLIRKSYTTQVNSVTQDTFDPQYFYSDREVAFEYGIFDETTNTYTKIRDVDNSSAVVAENYAGSKTILVFSDLGENYSNYHVFDFADNSFSKMKEFISMNGQSISDDFRTRYYDDGSMLFITYNSYRYLGYHGGNSTIVEYRDADLNLYIPSLLNDYSSYDFISNRTISGTNNTVSISFPRINYFEPMVDRFEGLPEALTLRNCSVQNSGYVYNNCIFNIDLSKLDESELSSTITRKSLGANPSRDLITPSVQLNLSCGAGSSWDNTVKECVCSSASDVYLYANCAPKCDGGVWNNTTNTCDCSDENATFVPGDGPNGQGGYCESSAGMCGDPYMIMDPYTCEIECGFYWDFGMCMF